MSLSGVSAPVKVRFTRSNPCPICNRTHACSQTADGLIFCKRVVDSFHPPPGFFWLGTTKDGEWGLWRRDDGDWHKPRPRAKRGPGRPKKQQAEPDEPDAPRDFSPDVEAYHRRVNTRLKGGLDPLAARLGVSAAALADLKIGLSPWQTYTIPERDHAGRVIGIGERAFDGRKAFVGGGHRGLVYAADAFQGDGPLYLVEGMSDVAALLSMGLRAIGRPSNVGGVAHLEKLLVEAVAAGVIDKRTPVVVVGENDRKADGSWPGRDGAVKTAERLQAAIPRTYLRIYSTLPPDGAKDVRAWLRQQGADLNNAAGMKAVGERLRDFLDAKIITCRSSVCSHPSYTELRHVIINGSQNADLYESLQTNRPCRRGSRRLLEMIPSTPVPSTQDAAFGLSCKRWDCTACSPRLKERWGEHACQLVHDAETMGHSLHVFQGRESEWDAVKQRLAPGANFLRVKSAGVLCVLSDGPFAGSEPADAHGAAEAAVTAILAVADSKGGKPVRCSRGWELGKVESERKYIDQGPIERDQKGVVKAAEQLGVDAVEWVSDDLPEGVTDATNLYYPPDAIGDKKERMRDKIAGRPAGWKTRRKGRKPPADHVALGIAPNRRGVDDPPLDRSGVVGPRPKSRTPCVEGMI